MPHVRHGGGVLSPWPLALAGVVGALACAPSSPPSPGYHPRTRAISVTTIPLLVKEEEQVLPFLRRAFATGGVLEGKEVYAFSPNSITVVEGDTIRLTLINPEDDLHSFALPDLLVPLPGNTRVDTAYVARRAGIFSILCTVPGHLPMMSGQLVVLPAATFGGATGS